MHDPDPESKASQTDALRRNPAGTGALRAGVAALVFNLLALHAARTPDDGLLPLELMLTLPAAVFGVAAAVLGRKGLSHARRDGSPSRSASWGLGLGVLAVLVFLGSVLLFVATGRVDL